MSSFLYEKNKQTRRLEFEKKLCLLFVVWKTRNWNLLMRKLSHGARKLSLSQSVSLPDGALTKSNERTSLWQLLIRFIDQYKIRRCFFYRMYMQNMYHILVLDSICKTKMELKDIFLKVDKHYSRKIHGQLVSLSCKQTTFIL